MRTSEIETAWGVVTITAPASCCGCEAVDVAGFGLRLEEGRGGRDSSVSASEICSSEVPGGVSMRRYLVPGGQRTSVKNCRTMAVFLGPRHTTADERDGRRKPKDIMWRDPIAAGSDENVQG